MKKSKSYILVGNWKMNPTTYTDASRLFRGLIKKAALHPKVKTIVCPPSIYLGRLKDTSETISLGAQDASAEETGAHTGNISVPMLINAGASHVIVGHSECRKRGDTSDMVNKKMHAVFDRGLMPIVCIGEEVRNDAGEHLAFLKQQLSETFKGISKKHAGKMMIAYEPVWAIGATTAMDPHSVHEMSLFIKKTMSELFKGITMDSFLLLYGGAVDPGNARAIVHEGQVNGLLVGRQSLDAEAFGQIMSAIS